MTIVNAVLARAPSPLSSRVAADLIKYGVASAAAFVLDFSMLLLLNKGLGVNHLVAAAVGFLAGLTLVYALSVRYVFGDRRRFAARAEILGFLVTGLIGLAITAGLMHLLVDYAGLPVAFAKLPTAAVVFAFNFVLRRTLLFSPNPADKAAS